ncbi:bifunctional DNA primase/polymerase [Streptomyces sp. SID12501]|uniref:DNA primase/polymerase bifunctional N-terminal domain-containing protein n=1 Tax=Streptomyces sp. SID12501 TaxID=2706042 RepID=A0A6B3C5Z8_9ACTN|nr:hypothetical protein [Streptomyces sp. SID12501]
MNDEQQAAESTAVKGGLWLTERQFATFPADHPALPQCSGIGRGHDPATCEQRGKHPSVAFTRDHTVDPEEIRRQLTRRPQNVAVYIGACRGPAGEQLVVVDSDRPGAIEDVAKARGETWPVTMRVLTAKGYHDYFWAPAGLKLGNRLGTLKGQFDGDVRAGNAYVIGPGSVHATGVIYTLENTEQAPVQAPAWLLDALTARPAAPAAPVASISISMDRLDSYTRKVLQDECDAITRAPEGDQNNTINTAAFNFGTLVGAGALAEGEAREHLLAAARAGNHPEGRALQTVESGLRAGMAQPRDPWPPVGRESAHRQDEPPEDSGETTAEPADRLPATFWNATAVLQRIQQMACARRASPDAVLHAVLARTAAMADPTVRVDSGIHQPATIGWYCGLFGPSGSGKGNAENTAEELTPFPMVDLAYIDISTGQGLIAAYLDLDIDPDDDDGKKKILIQRRTRGYALATEGSVLDAMAQMSAAATLNGVLCKAWMSERQGTSNAEVERRRALPKGAYTLSMSLGVQEEPAAKLLEMGSIGLPQRLAWAHATLGPDTPEKRPATTDPVTVTIRNGKDVPVTTWVSGLRGTTISVPEHVTDELDQLALAISFGRGATAPLDTHEPLWRLKCAALLALLHGRTKVKTEDWDMATVMWETSRKVRGRVQDAAKRRTQAELDARRAEAVLTAAESQAAVYEVVNGVHPSVMNVAKRAHRYLTRHDCEIPVRDVNRNCIKKPDRDKYRASGATDSLWSAALQYGCEQGWLVLLADGALLSAGSVAPEQS